LWRYQGKEARTKEEEINGGFEKRDPFGLKVAFGNRILEEEFYFL